ncbi:MAG: SDR family oxidoreductase [Actinomycetota bacterium]|jgi:NAD(P)-dependent dehydrogenase (short-subunit alcohol dehydrogenase family)|nr:SDR family oxidoreductase [Actinomycetota bacterium]
MAAASHGGLRGLRRRTKKVAGDAPARSHADAVDDFAAQVTERFGTIDVWVNNAGVLDPIGSLRDTDAGDIAAHLAVNVMGVATAPKLTSVTFGHAPARGCLVGAAVKHLRSDDGDEPAVSGRRL